MSNIDSHLLQIMRAVYGRDMRQSIHDAIKQCHTDAVKNAGRNSYYKPVITDNTLRFTRSSTSIPEITQTYHIGPEKGVDYYTEAEKTEFLSKVFNVIQDKGPFIKGKKVGAYNPDYWDGIMYEFVGDDEEVRLPSNDLSYREEFDEGTYGFITTPGTSVFFIGRTPIFGTVIPYTEFDEDRNAIANIYYNDDGEPFAFNDYDAFEYIGDDPEGHYTFTISIYEAIVAIEMETAVYVYDDELWSPGEDNTLTLHGRIRGSSSYTQLNLDDYRESEDPMYYRFDTAKYDRIKVCNVSGSLKAEIRSLLNGTKTLSNAGSEVILDVRHGDNISIQLSNK